MGKVSLEVLDRMTFLTIQSDEATPPNATEQLCLLAYRFLDGLSPVKGAFRRVFYSVPPALVAFAFRTPLS